MDQVLEKSLTERAPCRAVTAEEAAFYRDNGWVQLKKFLSPDILQFLLRRAVQQLGEDGDSNAPFGTNTPYFNAEQGHGLGDTVMRNLLENLGAAGKPLLGRKSGAHIRYYFDYFAPKLPTAQKTKNAGNGPTDFHQDFPTQAVDRAGGMTFWMPLEAYGPEFGTMSFYSGSHKLGPVGNYSNYFGKDIREVYPEVLDCEFSGSLTYELGDVTVHNHMVVHGAQANVTDRPRWVYMLMAQPEDAHWNGAPPEAFDPTGMEPHSPFDDVLYPVLGRNIRLPASV